SMIRPVIEKPQRRTIILRELPSTTPEEEIRSAFDMAAIDGTITDLHSDVADTWVISFSNEEEAVRALQHVRKQQIGGKPVAAELNIEQFQISNQQQSNIKIEESLEKENHRNENEYKKDATDALLQFKKNAGVFIQKWVQTPRGSFVTLDTCHVEGYSARNNAQF
ncbi:MAG: hypothetical protein EZS28_046541, partial [Streblomastix strix]